MEQIIYNGSLEELNSLDKNSQYKIVSHYFRTNGYNITRILFGLENELKEANLDGLVNARTFEATNFTFVEGTPIKRIEK
ncbi:MAG: hypothetical protein WC812_03385 [Candidatus Pacearchaeota archaeon]|jgi:hypothetical protein